MKLTIDLMKNTKIKHLFAGLVLFSTLGMAVSANAAPILFFQLAQATNIKPEKGSAGCFEKCLTKNNLPATANIITEDLPVIPGDDKKKTAPQDERVITVTTAEIVEDDACECADVVVIPPVGGFPAFAYLALPLPALIFAGVADSDNPVEPEVISPMRP